VNCDLCNVLIGPADVHRVSNGEFKTIVDQGYDPYARGRMPVLATDFLVSLTGTEAALSGWRQMVARDTTDWGLCAACAADVDTFVAALPVPV